MNPKTSYRDLVAFVNNVAALSVPSNTPPQNFGSTSSQLLSLQQHIARMEATLSTVAFYVHEAMKMTNPKG